ncbi:MAG TPA: DUF2189 domain-containing protein [Croceibacterium sp.]|nr:DUF2189 domain-containing protein [Croceibacterium sp.]
MTTIPPVVPPLPVKSRFALDLPANAGFAWLAAGWRDLRTQSAPSLAYGVIVMLLSAAIVAGLWRLGWDFALFPALAGFLVFAPALATGLYEKSRALESGEPVTFRRMLFPRPASGGQVLFTGALLLGLILLWMRAAIIIYALFFGVTDFPGLDHVAGVLFTTSTGAAMLVVGSVVGALFAAFSLAISAFSIPMMYDRDVDALTAMGASWALVWNNRRAMIVWGAIVLVLFVASIATALVGLVVVFPLLGHATWHAYRAVPPELP